jgi:hypothetical protein
VFWFYFYGLRFFEIVKLKEPRLLFGQIDHKFEIQAICKAVREGFFHEPIELLQIRESIRTSQLVTIQDIVETISVPSSRCGGKIQIISGKRTSANRAQFLDYVNNTQDYKGCIVYLTDIDEDEVYGNFDQPDKFYFNEAGIWIESPLFTIP